jgi:hypothetical protein
MDDLTKEFKKFAKEQELKELRDSIADCTERDFHKLKDWALLLFDKNMQLQKMYEELMREKLIGKE